MKKDNEAKGGGGVDGIEHTGRQRRLFWSGFWWHVSRGRERERGRGRKQEEGLNDIMCCYSPAEAWQEDFNKQHLQETEPRREESRPDRAYMEMGESLTLAHPNRAEMTQI